MVVGYHHLRKHQYRIDWIDTHRCSHPVRPPFGSPWKTKLLSWDAPPKSPPVSLWFLLGYPYKPFCFPLEPKWPLKVNPPKRRPNCKLPIQSHSRGRQPLSSRYLPPIIGGGVWPYRIPSCSPNVALKSSWVSRFEGWIIQGWFNGWKGNPRFSHSPCGRSIKTQASS